jgi:hypothetical protein
MHKGGGVVDRGILAPMMPDREDAQRILETAFQTSGWIVQTPAVGNHAAFIAARGEERVFLKFGVNAPVLRRLADLRLTPAVLSSGEANGRTYAIQRYVDGVHPEPVWFAAHLPVLARSIRRYHTDEALSGLLRPTEPPSYHDHITTSLASLHIGLAAAKTTPLRESTVREGFARLTQQAHNLQPTPLVPVHPDPNNTNILLTGDGFSLLDWDEITLSDPVRDMGLLLWWYVPHAIWPELFTAYGMRMHADIQRKIYWWSAFTSLGVAIWLDTHTENARAVDAFLLDFNAAVHGQSNPHAH